MFRSFAKKATWQHCESTSLHRFPTRGSSRGFSLCRQDICINICINVVQTLCRQDWLRPRQQQSPGDGLRQQMVQEEVNWGNKWFRGSKLRQQMVHEAVNSGKKWLQFEAMYDFTSYQEKLNWDICNVDMYVIHITSPLWLGAFQQLPMNSFLCLNQYLRARQTLQCINFMYI